VQIKKGLRKIEMSEEKEKKDRNKNRKCKKGRKMSVDCSNAFKEKKRKKRI